MVREGRKPCRQQRRRGAEDGVQPNTGETWLSNVNQANKRMVPGQPSRSLRFEFQILLSTPGREHKSGLRGQETWTPELVLPLGDVPWRSSSLCQSAFHCCDEIAETSNLKGTRDILAHRGFSPQSLGHAALGLS